MKKIIIVLLLPVIAFCETTIVKAKKIIGVGGRETYVFTFTTVKTSVDTFILLNDNGSWIDLGGVCDFYNNSSMNLQCNTTERTPDSTRFVICWQLSSHQNPRPSGRLWFSALVDSSSFNNVWNIGRKENNNVAKFGRSQYLIDFDKMRLMVYETGGTHKDAPQTVTMALTLIRCEKVKP